MHRLDADSSRALLHLGRQFFMSHVIGIRALTRVNILGVSFCAFLIGTMCLLCTCVEAHQHNKELVVVTDRLEHHDVAHDIDYVYADIKNTGSRKFDSAVAVWAFYGLNWQFITTARIQAYGIKPGAVWRAAIPITSFGEPPITEYALIDVHATRGNRTVWARNDSVRNANTIGLTLSLVDDGHIVTPDYHGPTVDSAFLNPDLELDFATLGHDELTGLPYIEGVVRNVSDKEYDYVEIDGCLLTVDEGDQVDSQITNTEHLAPFQSWHFRINFLTDQGGIDCVGWRIAKLSGTKNL